MGEGRFWGKLNVGMGEWVEGRVTIEGEGEGVWVKTVIVEKVG